MKILNDLEKEAFSHNVFYPSQTYFSSSITFILLSVNAFNLKKSKNLLFVKEITLS